MILLYLGGHRRKDYGFGAQLTEQCHIRANRDNDSTSKKKMFHILQLCKKVITTIETKSQGHYVDHKISTTMVPL